MSGSVNGDGSLKMVAEKTVADSQYQTIVNLVKESAARPAHFVRLADRYAVPFTLVAYLIAGVAWFVSKKSDTFCGSLSGCFAVSFNSICPNCFSGRDGSFKSSWGRY